MEWVWTTVGAAIGVVLTTLWEQWADKRKELQLTVWRIRAETLSKRLSELYWPIYLRLQRDNVIWRRLLDRDHPDEAHRKLARSIEEQVLLPNHEDTARLILSAIHLLPDDKELEALLVAYVRHVDVYRALRAAGVWDRDPLAVGEPFPANLFNVLETRLRATQAQYEAVLRAQGVG